VKRSIIGAILTVGLLAAPFAYAQTNYAPIGDPYNDTIQLWSEIAAVFSALGSDLAAVFNGHQVSAVNNQAGPASVAAAVSTFNAPATARPSPVPQATLEPTNSAPLAPVPPIEATNAVATLPPLSDYVTQSELSAALLQLSNSLSAQFSTPQSLTLPQNVAADGNEEAPFAAENSINNLSNVTISNANLTASEIPTLNYFPSTSTISIGYGGTGTSNSPTYGQLLLGNGNGGYSLVSTSSLGIAGTNYWTLSGSSLFNNSGTNIGIGTSTPWSDIANGSSLLDLTSNSVVRLTLHDTATTQEEKLSSDGTGFYIDSAGAASASNNNIVFRVSNTNHSYTTYEAGRFTAAGLFGVGTTSPWAQLSASSTSANPVLAIQQNSTGPAAVFLGGNVGIGTTSPSAMLAVTGAATVSNLAVASTNTGVAPFFVDGELPQQVATLPSGYYSTSVVANGTYLYGLQILGMSSFGLSVYDISNPLSPVLVSSTILTPSYNGFNSVTGELRIAGHYLFMISNQGSGAGHYNVIAVDISNPRSPVIINPSTCQNSCSDSFGEGFDIAGRYLYQGGYGGLYTYDESDPYNPVLVSLTSSTVVPFSISERVRGDYLYNLDASDVTPAFSVVNIKNPSAPTLMASLPLSEGVPDVGGHNRIALSGNYAYVQDGSANLLTINIASPSSPFVVATSTLPGGSALPDEVFVAGRDLYALSANGLNEYNISTSSSPQYVGIVSGITSDIAISGRYMYGSNGSVYDLGGAYIQRATTGDLTTDTLQANQSASIFGNLNAFGGLTVGAAGLLSYGPGGFSGTGGANVLEVTAATTSNSTGQTASFDAELIRNFATSSSASIIKTGLNVISQGSWTGTGSSNIGLYVSSVTGGTNNYDAVFNGGGNVGIGTSNPYSRLQVTGPNSAATTSAFAVVNSASTTVFSVFDNGNSTYSGSIFQSSDQRLKTNVQSLDASSSLSAIELLNPVSYLRLDQPGTGENLGFIAQQVQQVFPQLVSTTSATALTPDGTLTLNYEGLISPIVSAIQGIANITSTFQQNLIAWLGNASNGITDLYATVIHASTGNFSNELCVGSACVTPAQFQAMVAAANASQSSEQGSGPQPSDDPTDTPPVIEVNGDNPAIVQVGATYNDLGATITGPQQDLNLGISTFVNGVTMSPVQIDTSAIATDTIDYVATDQNGLTSTSTRTVIIEAPANDNTPPSAATTTSSTSTPS
jgi:hypothetical protein